MQATKSRTTPPGLLGRQMDFAKLPWWGIFLVLIGVIAVFLIIASKNYQETFLYLLDGIATTLRITLFAYLLATIIGLLTGLARVSKNVFIYNLSTLYVSQ